MINRSVETFSRPHMVHHHLALDEIGDTELNAPSWTIVLFHGRSWRSLRRKHGVNCRPYRPHGKVRSTPGFAEDLIFASVRRMYPVNVPDRNGLGARFVIARIGAALVEEPAPLRFEASPKQSAHPARARNGTLKGARLPQENCVSGARTGFP